MRKLIVLASLFAFASIAKAQPITGAGGLQRVIHDNTLTGEGTTPHPLSVVGAATYISGTLTSPKLVVATGAHTVGDFGGSDPGACPAGQADAHPALSASGTLTKSCSVFVNAAGAGLSLSGSSVSMPNTGPGVSTVTYATITTDAQGRVTASSSGAAPALASTTITAGNGLTGGGDLSANRTIDVGAGTGIAVNANDVQLAINGGVAQNCSASNAVTGISATGIETCSTLATLGAASGTGASPYLTKWSSTTAVTSSSVKDNAGARSGTNRQDVQYGNSGVFDLSIAGAADVNANAYIFQNAYEKYNTGGDATLFWQATNGSFGTRGIAFKFADGISFYADGVATTADTSFTPTRRMFISNGGGVTVDQSLAVGSTGNGNVNIGADTTLTTTAQNGLHVLAFSDGSNYIDSKTIAAGKTYFRYGSGAQTGGAGNWLILNNGGAGATEWVGAATLDSTAHIVGALTEDGNSTLGSATSNTTTVNGRLSQTDTPSASTATRFSIASSSAGTYDTTSGALYSIGVVGSSTSTRAAGGNALNNIGLYGNATSGTNNYAVYTDNGNIKLNVASGTFEEVAAATFDSTVGISGHTWIGAISAVADPFNVDGRESATSGIVARFSSAVSGSRTFLQLSDGFTYNYGIGTDGATGDLLFSSSVFAGAAGTERMRIAQGGAVTIPGNTYIGGTAANAHTLEIYGASQTTTALTDAGNALGEVYVADSGSVVTGIGGAVTFGAHINSGSYKRQAAIKLSLQDGSNNGSGNLAFSVRVATADTALTEAMKITATPQLDMDSHKIINCANGSSSTDVACFGQIATGVNAAVSVTANTIAMGGGSAHTVVDSPLLYDGSTYIYSAKPAWFDYQSTADGDALTLAYNAAVDTTSAHVGMKYAFDEATDGRIYWESKLGGTGTLIGLVGAGTSSGNTNQWLSVTGAGAVTLSKSGQNTQAAGTFESVGAATLDSNLTAATGTIGLATTSGATTIGNTSAVVIVNSNQVNFHGSAADSYFYYSNADTYIRGNGASTHVYIGDNGTSGTVEIAAQGATTNDYGQFAQTYTSTAVAGDAKGVSASNSGTFNTTAAGRNAYGLYVANSSAISSGANTLTSIAAYLDNTSSGANITQYVLYTDHGDVRLNATNGITGIKGPFQVDNTNSSATDISAQLNYTRTARAADVQAVNVSQSGTVDVTAANRNSYGIKISNTTSKSAGNNSFAVYGVYSDTSGAGATNQIGNFGMFANGGDIATASSGTETHTLKVNGHENTGGTALVNGDLSACGTGTPTVGAGSTDMAGLITEGTTATGCTLTFKATYTNAPFCSCTGETSGSAAVLVGCSTTATTLVVANASATGDKIYFQCIGQRGGS